MTLNGGAALSWSPTLELSWSASGPPATHYAVSLLPAFGTAQWRAVPASLPSRLPLPDGEDRLVTVYVKLLNAQGESAVRSASIQLRQPPRLQSAVVVSGLGLPAQVMRLDATFSGRATRWAVSPSAAPPTDASVWHALGAASPGPLSTLFTFGPPVFPTATLVTGRRFGLYLHLQRDDSPVDSRAVSFDFTGPPSTYTLNDGWEMSPFRALMGTRHLIASLRLTSTGACVAATGTSSTPAAAAGTPGLWAIAGAAAAPSAVRCRFTLFGGQALNAGWTVASIRNRSGTDPRGSCAVIAQTLGNRPNVVVETTLIPDGSPGAVEKSAVCPIFEQIELRGPWSDGETGLGAIR